MSIFYNDIRTLQNKQVPANVKLEFNAGVYLSAIKPVLENIQEGWKTDIQNVTVLCNEVSERTDASKSLLVSTKLILSLLSKNVPSKVVLHFYHTSDSVQIQGSSMIQGMSSVAWLVEFLIKPLANAHIQSSRVIIQNINT